MPAPEKPALKKIEKLLSKMENLNSSDLHLKVYSPPIFRINGIPRRTEGESLTPEKLEARIQELLTPELSQTLNTQGSVDFALGISGVGRFRINIYRQRGSISFCARRVNTNIATIEELLLPKSINQISAYENGIVLVVGATGSGKSSTLASMISQINASRRCHILTIEDPIEYVYRDDKSFINQREIGLDVDSFNTALRYALRQDPDVILIGEMRDAKTIETALSAAETGHLVFTTLHANNATQTISRILDFFPGERQTQIRHLLAFTMRAVVAQKLIPGCKPKHPRVPAVELMFVNPVIKKMIYEGQDNRIPESIRNQSGDGMQDFNMSLYKLAKTGLLTEDAALEHSPNPEQLRMQFKGMVLNQDQASMKM